MARPKRDPSTPCVKCGAVDRYKDGRCRPCRLEWDKPRRKTTAHKEKRYEATRRRALRIKLRVFSHYSETKIPRCACCGESSIQFLQLDHIDENGADERKQFKHKGSASGWQFYLYLEQQGFPPGYQVLCANCNFAKAYWPGGCPHKKGVTQEQALATRQRADGARYHDLYPSLDIRSAMRRDSEEKEVSNE
jgi:hypothetical protein